MTASLLAGFLRHLVDGEAAKTLVNRALPGHCVRDARNGSASGRSSTDGVLEEMNLWDQILARVETKVNRHSFYTWFKPTSFVAEDARRDDRSCAERRFQGLADEALRGRHQRGA